MARLRTSGFELGEETVEFDSKQGSANTVWFLFGAPVRTGAYSLQSTGGATNSVACELTGSNVSDNTVYSRVYIYVSSLPTASTGILTFVDSGNTRRAGITIETDGTLKLYANSTQIGSASDAVIESTWTMIELSYNNNTSSGKAELSARLNGVVFASTTTSTEIGAIYHCRIGNQNSGATASFYFDDFAVNDSTGLNQNSWPGGGAVIALRPSGSGDSNQFLKSGGGAGSSTNYQDVDDVPPDDVSTYIKSKTTGDRDLYRIQAPSFNRTSSINVVEVHCRFSEGSTSDNSTGNASMKNTMSGTIIDGTDITETTTSWLTNRNSTPRIANITRYTDPDNLAWTFNTLKDLQIGMRISTGNTNFKNITALWLIVDYVEGESTDSPSDMLFGLIGR